VLYAAVQCRAKGARRAYTQMEIAGSLSMGHSAAGADSDIIM
jgi:hypothetical protein